MIHYQIDHAPIDRDYAINKLLDTLCRWSTKTQIDDYDVKYCSDRITVVVVTGRHLPSQYTDVLQMPENRTAMIYEIQPAENDDDNLPAIELPQDGDRADLVSDVGRVGERTEGYLRRLLRYFRTKQGG